MATIGQRYVDLIDLYKREDRNRDIAVIIELLAQTNSILDDAIAIECNNGTSHRTTVRTGLPAVTWGQLYKGIPQSKSTTAQVEDATGFVEGLSTVDQRLLEISKDPNRVRLTEAQSFLESLSQEVATTIFYGDVTADPKKFTGLSARFSDPTAPNGGQLVDGGGTGSNNTSVWFVTWGDRQCHLLYPEGTRAGIAREDKGQQRVVDSNGNAYYAMEELFRWHVGLTVRDWRFVSRICNIDVDDLKEGKVDIYGLFRQAFWKLRSHRVMGGRQAIYCNADVLEALDAAATPTVATSGGSASSFVRLTPQNIDGREVLTYRGIPVRQCDALLNTEAAISFPS